MRLIRIVAPALVGALLLLVALQTTTTGLGENGESAIPAFRTGLLPAALGVALLLSALAIARRTRAGYLLGIGVAVLMVLAGLGLVVIEIGYLGRGGLSSAFAGGIIVVAVGWCLLWLGYLVSVRRSRADFASTTDRGDRRFAIVIAALAIFSAGAYLALGAIESTAVANQSIDQAQAAALVAGTTLTVEVVDVRVGAASGEGTGPPVEHLALDVSIRSATSYLLSTGPHLCLTDLATYEDPAYKPDVFCWGTPDPDTALLRAFGGAPVTPDARRVRLELDRGASLCPFGAGMWNAALALGPQLGAAPGGGVGPAPELYTITTVFEVAGASASPPDVEAASCTELSVSP